MGLVRSRVIQSPCQIARSRQGVGKELGVDYRVLESIGDFCQEARSLSEIAEHLGLGDRYKMKKKYIDWCFIKLQELQKY